MPTSTTTPTSNDELYKFRPLREDADTNKDRSYVEDILLNHRLYCAPARSFNDPFECRVRWNYDAPQKTKLARVVQGLMRSQKLSLRQARRRAPSCIDAAENGAIEGVTNWLLDTVGMACLVAAYDNVLMWSHYASGHTGICIKFQKRSTDHFVFFGDASKVNYQDDVPIVNWYKHDKMEIVRKSVYTKATMWKYEREHRIVQPKLSPDRYYYFDPHLVTAVYLGCCISDKDRELVTQCCKNRVGTVSIYQARRSDTAYSLTYHKL